MLANVLAVQLVTDWNCQCAVYIGVITSDNDECTPALLFSVLSCSFIESLSISILDIWPYEATAITMEAARLLQCGNESMQRPICHDELHWWAVSHTCKWRRFQHFAVMDRLKNWPGMVRPSHRPVVGCISSTALAIIGMQACL